MNIQGTQSDSASWYPLTPVSVTLVPPILPDTVHFDWSSAGMASAKSLPVPATSLDTAATGTLVDRNA
jgi:hypothetical protein